MSWRKCVVFDFESVIAPRAGVELHNVKEAIHWLRKNGFRVEITSPRCEEIAGIAAVEDYLVENDIMFDYVRYGIPPCLCYISNNAIPFTGDVESLFTKIAELE